MKGFAIATLAALCILVGTVSGATKGFVRSAKGQLTTIVDPQDTGGYTQAIGINAEGTVVGTFFNPAAPGYQGFFYRNGMFSNYILPSKPTNTVITGINDGGDLCGYYQNAPTFVPSTGFLSDEGRITSFLGPGGTNVYDCSTNDFGFAAGEYQDSAGVNHGFVRDPRGKISTVDVPGASTASGLGTVLLGLNNVGWVSGHFWDSSGKPHGFIGVRYGESWEFFQIDVPGAAQTYGGGLNDFGTVVGHYVTSGGQQLGYIASPF